MTEEIAIHLYRALLRECTYLPDPVARRYISSHISRRFRDYPAPGTLPRTTPYPVQRIQKLLKSARTERLFLARANDGHLDALEKVLLHAYGRAGRRRHELMLPLRAQGPPETQEAVSTVVQKRNAGTISGIETKLTEQMEALAKSQNLRGVFHGTRTPIKGLESKTDLYNSWGRPMPQNRIPNLETKRIAGVLERLLPPLPQSDWETLHKLATGKEKFVKPVRRAQQADITMSDIPSTQPSKYPQAVAVRKHNITARVMRRLWTRVFQLCPIMTFDASKSAWKIRWGDGGKPVEQIFSLGENEDALSLFDSVDTKGKIPKMSSRA